MARSRSRTWSSPADSRGCYGVSRARRSKSRRKRRRCNAMLYSLPLVFVLIGLALYTVLAGADFGAGFWQLFAGRSDRAERVREHAHDSMAPVWEANHVWLIFVLTVFWTAYPKAFGSIASTLSLPLFIAALGIIFRGAAYALRAGAASSRESALIHTIFSVSSILAPFALGAAIGGIATNRVPVGNASGHLVSSWLNATSVFIGVLAVALSAYLAAVYLTADAARRGEPALEREFRVRALGAGVVLFPALALLFRLTLTRLRAEEAQPAAQAIQAVRAVTTRLLARSAIACLIVGFAALNVADAGWAHAIGVVCLLAFVALGFRALILPALGEEAATR